MSATPNYTSMFPLPHAQYTRQMRKASINANTMLKTREEGDALANHNFILCLCHLVWSVSFVHVCMYEQQGINLNVSISVEDELKVQGNKIYVIKEIRVHER